MNAASLIRWIERSPYLHEARVTIADGADLYAGYVGVTPVRGARLTRSGHATVGATGRGSGRRLGGF